MLTQLGIISSPLSHIKQIFLVGQLAFKPLNIELIYLSIQNVHIQPITKAALMIGTGERPDENTLY